MKGDLLEVILIINIFDVFIIGMVIIVSMIIVGDIKFKFVFFLLKFKKNIFRIEMVKFSRSEFVFFIKIFLGYF